jgi:hypothetical protein
MSEETQSKDIIQFNQLTTSLKSMETINSDERYFEGLLTVQMKDKQGEVTIVDELYKVLPIWMDRGAPISDTHSNRIIGKGINYSKTIVKDEHGEDLPAIKITGKIYKNYELDNVIWNKIVTKEYRGLSFGGATRANRMPMKMKDGSMAYALGALEHYEVAVCKDPAVPMAIITDFNPIAKANYSSTVRDDKMVIQCTDMGCYIDKADLNESQTFQQKVDALIREGKSEESAKKIVGSFVHKEELTEGGKKVFDEVKNVVDRDKRGEENQMYKSGYQTEAGNNQLGGQGKTEDDKEKREKEDEEKEDDKVKRRDHSDAGGDIHSMYNQNVGREASSGRKLKGDTTVNQTGGVRGGQDTAVQGSGKSNDINIVQKKPERNEEKLISNIKVVRNINNSLVKHAQIQQLKKIKGALPDMKNPRYPKGDIISEFPESDGSRAQSKEGQATNVRVSHAGRGGKFRHSSETLDTGSLHNAKFRS